jgi:hypothetical protein
MNEPDRQAYAWQLPKDAGARENLAAAVYADGTRHVRVKAGMWYNYPIGIGNPGAAGTAPVRTIGGTPTVATQSTTRTYALPVPPITLMRFWGKIEQTDSCWLWLAATKNGYGIFRYNGRNYRAHVFSYWLHKGRIPKGLCVCHNCPGGDNRACVNPDHLFLGTKKQNSEDMVAKGQSTRGERHKKAKLRTEQVKRIRERRAAGERARVIAEDYGIHWMHVYRICRGERWKDAT